MPNILKNEAQKTSLLKQSLNLVPLEIYTQSATPSGTVIQTWHSLWNTLNLALLVEYPKLGTPCRTPSVWYVLECTLRLTVSWLHAHCRTPLGIRYTWYCLWYTLCLMFPGNHIQRGNRPLGVHRTCCSLEYTVPVIYTRLGTQLGTVWTWRYTLNLVPPGVYSSCDMHSTWYSLDYTVPVIHSTLYSLEYTVPAI